MMTWRTGRFAIDLGQPRVMGIINVTPDSFSDGGRCIDAASAIAHCDTLLREGAHILDIGGESTRPGARTPSAEEVDTSQPLVMRAALDLGVDIVNDVRALQRPGALDVLAGHATAGVCVMHMQGEPGTMQAAPHYGDVVTEVRDFLAECLAALCERGIDVQRIVIDPGIGFGKGADHNLALLRRQRELLVLGAPLLVGWSRKSTLGALTGRAVGDRMVASVAAAMLAVERGARIVRVHDVAATVDALTVWHAASENNEGV
jgi:dihydropteroate synthase